MKIWAKIGTHSAAMVKIKYKRFPPKKNTIVLFKMYPYGRYAKWVGGFVYDVKDINGDNLYFIELL